MDDTEFEIKLLVPAAGVEGVERALRRAPVQRERLQARYFDTADAALAAQRVALRLRKEGSRWVQTVKAPGASALDRLEHNAPVEGRGVPAVDLARHAGTAAGERLRDALGKAGADALQLVYSTDITRESRSLRAGDATVEIAFDRGEVRAGRARAAVCELELELKEGRNPAPVIELAQRWCAEHGLWLDTVSKSARGQRLAGGDAPVPVRHAAPLRYPARATLRQAARAVVGNCMEQVLANATEVASGAGTDAHVHQLRVGLRRLRTALRELQPAFGGQEAQWEPELAALFRELGLHRDARTLAPALQRQMEAAGGPALRPDTFTEALPDVAAAVRRPGCQAVLLAVMGWLHAPQDDEAKDPPAARFAAQRLRKLHGKTLAEAKRFGALDGASQHQVRKRFKRLRYLAEFARPLFPGRKVDRYVGAIKPVQEALGQHQDALVALELWRAQAEREPAAWFGAGWLAARRGEHLHACEEACRAFAREARPFWD